MNGLYLLLHFICFYKEEKVMQMASFIIMKYRYKFSLKLMCIIEESYIYISSLAISFLDADLKY